jgi:hypothetical protein
MPCYNPLVAWRYEGKMVFNPPPNHMINKPFNLPCSKCIGCRFNYARSWALRCQLEALSHTDNCFITLTFNNEELHKRVNPWSVDVKDFQLFMKKLRKDLKKPIRFFHCGEYGEKTYRPHYHALIFGHDFRIQSPTNKVKKFGSAKYPLYESSYLTTRWGRGHCTVGELNFDTASYTARYVTKKIKGDATNIFINPITGEVSEINDVYCTMSRANGIGYEAYQKYKHNWYPNDFIVNGNGIKMKPPRYFDQLYESEFPEEFEKIKKQRKDNIDFVDQNPNDPNYRRLKDIENVKLLKLKETLREIDA